jgi:hypothetical protein
MSVRRFEASVTYRTNEGKAQEESFPVLASHAEEANRLALAYVLQVLRLDEFEMRVVGS